MQIKILRFIGYNFLILLCFGLLGFGVVAEFVVNAGSTFTQFIQIEWKGQMFFILRDSIFTWACLKRINGISIILPFYAYHRYWVDIHPILFVENATIAEAWYGIFRVGFAFQVLLVVLIVVNTVLYLRYLWEIRPKR